MSLVFNGTTVENVVYNGTALCKLVYNGTLVWEKHAYGSWTTTTAATCTATGSKKRTCTRTGCGVSETQSIAALGHSYSPAGSTWYGTTECIATGLCVHDQTHTTTQKGTITSEVTTPATCTTKGTTTYTATFSKLFGWTKAPDTATKQVQNIAATGHSYGSATYSWNGYTSCTATRTCANDSSHKETATATITSSVTKAATCTEAGTRTYAASFSASWASKQTKTETIAATGHTSSDWIIDSAATTVSTGSKHKECTVCGTVLETATIPKLNALTYTLLSDGTYSVKATDTHVSGAITIPSTYNGKAVTRIEDDAFNSCSSITSVTMPDSITYIGDSAFYVCYNMTTITMSNSVTYIGEWAFRNCSSLKTGVTIPASVTTIGACAFQGCDELLSVTFEHTKWKAGSTSVTVTAFNGATLLKTTYASVAWTKVSTPTLVAPVITDAFITDQGGGIELYIKNNNSVSVNCYVEVIDDDGTGAGVYDGVHTINANTSANIYDIPITSSLIRPFEISVYFEADGYLDSEWTYVYVE